MMAIPILIPWMCRSWLPRYWRSADWYEKRISLVTELDDKPFLEALLRGPNRSFRRYNLIFKDGVAQFERDPICKAYDEILEELSGPTKRPRIDSLPTELRCPYCADPEPDN